MSNRQGRNARYVIDFKSVGDYIDAVRKRATKYLERDLKEIDSVPPDAFTKAMREAAQTELNRRELWESIPFHALVYSDPALYNQLT